MKKNLKIYKSYNNIINQKNFNKMKIIRVSLALTIVLTTTSILGGCKKDNYHNDYGSTSDYYGDYEEYNDSNYYFDYNNINNYEQVPPEMLNLTFNIDTAQLSNFQDFVSNIQVYYKNSNIFGISKSLEAYNSLKKDVNIVSNDIIKNNKVYYDDLYEIISKNNKNYKKNNLTDNYYDELDNDELAKVIKIIVETINYNLKQNKNLNLNVLDYKLKNLKVFGYSDFGYAFYTQDEGVLALDIGSMPKKSNGKITAFEEIVIHETNHIFQDVMVKKDSNVEHVSGMCYQFKNLELNPLYWVWFVEAAAQSNTLTQKNLDVSDAVVYDTNVSSLNTLNSTSVLIKEHPNELANLATQSDLNVFFDYFNCKNDKDKEEILNMMVAHNLILDSNDIIYSNVFYNKNSITDEYEFNKELKCSIGQTESKIFYKNLAEKVKGKEVKLEDVFSLISVFETELSKEIWYDSMENSDYMGDFYENYTLIQNEFFQLISQKTGINIEELKDNYINYHNTTEHNNFNNSMLTNVQNEFYRNIYLENNYHKTQTVLEIQSKNVKYFK